MNAYTNERGKGVGRIARARAAARTTALRADTAPIYPLSLFPCVCACVYLCMGLCLLVPGCLAPMGAPFLGCLCLISLLSLWALALRLLYVLFSYSMDALIPYRPIWAYAFKRQPT